MQWIKRAWSGEERLWKVFWIYLVAVTIAKVIIFSVTGFDPYLQPKAVEYGWLFLWWAIYGTWLIVALWRCAFNLEWRFWGYAARSVVIFDVVGIGIIIFFAATHNPALTRLLAPYECAQAMAEDARHRGADPQQYIEQHDAEFRQCIKGGMPRSVDNSGVKSEPAQNHQQAEELCRQTMEDFAKKNGADPEKYVAQNQAYLQRCAQRWDDRFAASVASVPDCEKATINLAKKNGIDPGNVHELISDEAINNHFVEEYITARESFPGLQSPAAYANYNLVRVLSDPNVFTAYQQKIALKNPESPGARLGKEGSDRIRIVSIKSLDEHSLPDGNESRGYAAIVHVEEKRANVSNVLDKNITVEFKYTKLDLTAEDRCLNPLGFRVLSYVP